MGLVQDTELLKERFDRADIQFNHRASNRVADCLVKRTMGYELYNFSIELRVLSWIRNVLQVDLSTL